MSDFFIGRKEELDYLGKHFFVNHPSKGTCYSLQGPNDIGKTSLVKKARELFDSQDHPNVYYFNINFESSYKTHWGFWVKLIKKIAKTITKEELVCAPNPDESTIDDILCSYNFFSDNSNLRMLDEERFEEYNGYAIDYFDSLFDNFSYLGIHILLTIDEFDKAEEAFPRETNDGTFFNQLFNLSPKASDSPMLSILLISRKRVGTIAHHMYDGSDFESAFPLLRQSPLRGFSDEDLQLFFDSFSEIGLDIIDNEFKEEVLDICGRHPGLLTKMRSLYEDYYAYEGSCSPKKLYLKYSQGIDTIFNRMMSHLRKEILTRQASIPQNCIDSFNQAFIGPAYDNNLSSNLSKMVQYGILSINSKNKYEPISECFVRFFKESISIDDLGGLGKLISETEKSVRRTILQTLKENNPDNWEETLNEINPKKTINFLPSLETIAIENNARLRGIEYSVLNVYGFDEYAVIIIKYWEYMELYFRSYNSKTLKEDFCVLTKSRNVKAHENIEILDEQSCSNLNRICNRILSDIEKGIKKLPIEKEESSRELSPGFEETLIGETVTFCITEIKSKGNLIGYFEFGGNKYKAGISKNEKPKFGFCYPINIGETVLAKIGGYSENSGNPLYNLVAI